MPLIREYFQIKDSNVKQAIKDFRNSLKNELKDPNGGNFNFIKAANEDNGECYINLFRGGTKVFENIGNGKITTTNKAEKKFNKKFNKFEQCVGNSISKDQLQTMRDTMTRLFKKNAKDLIKKKQNNNKNGNQNNQQQGGYQCPLVKIVKDYLGRN